MSSRLVHVTVVPAFTVSCAGSKVKLSIVTDASSQWAADICIASAAAAASRMALVRKFRDIIRSLALQRRIDDGEALLAGFEDDAGGAEQAAQPVGGDLHRPGRWRGAGRGLREGGRACGMEGDVAFDLLHHLVDVAVEHGHRAEAFQEIERPRAVVGTPAPGRIDAP